MMTRVIQLTARMFLPMGLVVFFLGLWNLPGQAEEPNEPKSIRKTCGACPEGYATTGVTEAKEICKDGDPTLVQCVPLGANLLSVCGSCPDGYREIGNSNAPARCGNREGGRLTQCQLEKLELNLDGAVTVCDPDGIILEMNDKAVRTFQDQGGTRPSSAPTCLTVIPNQREPRRGSCWTHGG